VSRTWAELYPATEADGPIERAELVRADEWLALAQTLANHDPQRLRALGFSRDPDVLARFVATVPGMLTAETRAIGESVLARIVDLTDGLMALAAARALERLTARQDAGAGAAWWVPEDLDAPPSREPVSPAGAFTREDVDRVFSDL